MSHTANICFILAPERHGAEAVSLSLNNHPDVLSLGDMNPLRVEDPICSCGETFSSCPFWNKMREGIEFSPDDPLPTFLPQTPHFADSVGLNKFISTCVSLIANEIGPKAWRMIYEQAERFYGIHDRFLAAAQTQWPHKVFLDAERSNLKFMAMASMRFPVKGAIHLVRDPRSYVAAARRYYPEIPPEKLALEWVARHRKILRLKNTFTRVPFYRLRYEDFIAQPDIEGQKLLNFMHLRSGELIAPPLEPSKHHLLGIERFKGFNGRFEADEIWRDALPLDEQERVIRVCEPLFSEFGYKSQNDA